MFDKLPERFESHVKNDKGRLAFKSLFTDPLFIVREETDNDYGVDICVEALADSGKSVTNMRLHVQLKSSSKKANEAGSYSYTVAISNFNYLMNNPCSLYVFFSIKEDSFYYRFVDDIFSEYNISGDGWRRNKTITINFRDKLDKHALELIHEHLIQTSIMFKELRLEMCKKGIKPGAKFVYGEWMFESSPEKFERYISENNQPFAYSVAEDGRIIFLHDFIWESHHGQIPKGYQVYHVNGNTLDNRSKNLDIIKTTDIFDIEGFQREIEQSQAHNVLALIVDGNKANFIDVPPPPSKMFYNIIAELEKQGWAISDERMVQLKSDMVKYLDMNFI